MFWQYIGVCIRSIFNTKYLFGFYFFLFMWHNLAIGTLYTFEYRYKFLYTLNAFYSCKLMWMRCSYMLYCMLHNRYSSSYNQMERCKCVYRLNMNKAIIRRRRKKWELFGVLTHVIESTMEIFNINIHRKARTKFFLYLFTYEFPNELSFTQHGTDNDTILSLNS